MSWLTRPAVTGSPAAWSRDAALLGLVSCVGVSVPLLFIVQGRFLAWAAPLALVTGAVLGLLAPFTLELVRGRVPLLLLGLGAPVLGAAWGGAVGLAAGALSQHPFWPLGLVCGGLAGAMQVGLWWFPYTFQRVRSARTWPLLIGASVTAALLSAPVYVAGFVTALGFDGAFGSL